MLSPDNSVPLGRRVAYWRVRRQLSQQVFADRLGKSKSWVDKIERGVRRLDRVSVLREIADALRIDVAQLVLAVDGAQPPAGAQVGDGVARIREVLARYDTIVTPSGPSYPPVTDLRQAVAHGWLSFQYGRYDRLFRGLPRLLAEVQAHRGRHGDTESAVLLCQAYQLTAVLLRKVGQTPVAWVAADRAVAVGGAVGDEVLTARAVSTLGGVVRELGQPRRAYELCVAVAHRLAAPDQPVGEWRSVHGFLLLQAAMCAAQLGDDSAVTQLVDQAGDVAELVGPGENHHWTAFGPPLVEGVRIAAAVTLGDPVTAVARHERARTRPGYGWLPPGTRADHLVDAAHGYAHLDDLPAAGRALLAADRIAPPEVRLRPHAHAVLTTVLRGTPRPDPLLVRLAEACGLTAHLAR
ncbi:helix-turn-helix domain-containing protein [Micromonospora sp. SH-82]|uniref:helix-turn-helix domain-containing protein n=1 Tax=Micromonospora sp. SH-82 TaxID=3132938 RepID=UPI003EBAC7AD